MDIQPPPAQYLPYDGPLIVLERAPMQVIVICRALGVSGAPRGCSIYTVGGCLIVVPSNDIDGTIFRHEEAHCNGWRH